MTCREFADAIADYLAGEMGPAALNVFEGHRLACANSRRYLAHYQRAIGLARGAYEDTAAAAPIDLPDEFVGAILSARRRS